jgi:bifunctional oligoribonuclease and PAP phosphatase NrnA
MEKKELVEIQQTILSLIKESKRIMLLSHEYPDRDAVGSMIAMYWILRKLGKNDIIMLNETPHTVKSGFLEGLDKMIVGEVKDYINDCDLIMILDHGSWKRISLCDVEILKGKDVIVIDHHASDPDIPCKLCVSKIVSSNCELIYQIFNSLVQFDHNIAKALLMGIYDDTGSFSYPGVNTETYYIVGKLIELGVNIADISEEKKSISPKIFEVGKLLLDNTNIDKRNKYFSTYLSVDNVKKFNINYEEIEEVKDTFLPIILNLDGQNWGMMIKPKVNNTCSVSFRSKKDGINVQKIAGLFGGGGHQHSSGAIIEVKEPSDALKMIIDKLKKENVLK